MWFVGVVIDVISTYNAVTVRYGGHQKLILVQWDGLKLINEE